VKKKLKNKDWQNEEKVKRLDNGAVIPGRNQEDLEMYRYLVASGPDPDNSCRRFGIKEKNWVTVGKSTNKKEIKTSRRRKKIR
jgi:hypothetical protein